MLISFVYFNDKLIIHSYPKAQMSHLPKVSFIIPSFNRPKELQQALYSCKCPLKTGRRSFLMITVIPQISNILLAILQTTVSNILPKAWVRKEAAAREQL